MKRPARYNFPLIGFALLFTATLLGGSGHAMAVDTAVVGQPWSYYGGNSGAPFGPYAYPGAFGGFGAAAVDNPNPALNPGPANPFFLSTVSGRGSPHWGQAPGTGRFMLNSPASGPNR